MYTRKVLAGGQNCVLDAFASGMRAGGVKEERTSWVKETVEKVEREPKLDPVGSTVRYEMMKLCAGSV